MASWDKDIMASWDEDISASSDEDTMASWDKKLLTAAYEGNIKEVELCVKNRANLECRNFVIWTDTINVGG
ncbi:uncharacterized protein LOC143051556 isoform X2 [Mytilus galloprovincialis]|uniref:uncharacterized protein LOC143051556 isoform X2 n=1 Tax=Mytilus galloprovincialis TaxID=29158 RepID=UPI003F7B4FC8